MIKKIILIVMLFSTLLLGQQMKYTFGVNQNGDDLDGYWSDVDSTAATAYNIYFLLDDFYPMDLSPLVIDYDMDLGNAADSTLDGTIKINSDRSIWGTFWYFLDANEATDSINSTIKTYTGVYTSSTRSIANVKWDGTAVTLETISAVNDACKGLNIYTEATGYKQYPPEIIKIVFQPASGANAGTDIYYRIAYPAIYDIHWERIR